MRGDIFRNMLSSFGDAVKTHFFFGYERGGVQAARGCTGIKCDLCYDAFVRDIKSREGAEDG